MLTITSRQIMTTLQEHFVPTVNVAAERYRFRQREQLPNETVDSYIAALGELASTCKFGLFSDEILRDQLVEKKLTVRELTFYKAIEQVRLVKTAIKETCRACGKRPLRRCLWAWGKSLTS